MAKMMTQIDFLSKHLMGCGTKSVHMVRTNSGQFLDDAKFEDLYNEEFQYLGNKVGGGLGVLTPIINDKVGKVGTKLKMMVGNIVGDGNSRDREMEKDWYVPRHYRCDTPKWGA
ncbi:hypothetical protein MTR67_035006 [Solanum verrucosum]|uniref:Uncharacterized protein n=1 Tax=Solanum verrucosum TaxID=315347 RepID=A0AAF0U9L7_SOLVR|nr:hypothetical protein MTR67_035006 [Solanum verrucosum]